MENLLGTPRNSRDQLPTRLQNLSPQKYGKAAYTSLTYTPSKLAENVLFKEITSQKKIQQETSKLRQTQTMKQIIQDRLAQLQQQKDGIEKTLNEQIAMYKKMLKQNQEKNQKRIRTIQQNFNQQIERLLNQKQQEAKYSQSQKQLFQNKIYDLEQMLNQTKCQLANVEGNYLQQKNQNKKLSLINDSLNKRLEDTQNRMNKQQQRFKGQIQSLKRQIFNNEVQAKSKIQKMLNEKAKQIQNLQRLQRNQLEKIQNKRAQQTLIKNQEIKDLSATFQKQMSRLNNIISKKEDAIDHLTKTIQIQKQKTFLGSKGYENQISNLAHQKARLKQQLLKSDRKNQKLTCQVHDLQEKINNQITLSTSQISQLRKDLQLAQINYMRQADKNSFTLQDMDKQIIKLKIQNQKAAALAGQNVALHRQLRNMKQLLMQSSLQMQKCKDQFIRLGRQKDLLLIKLREVGIQNQTLYKIKNERQQQARGWRQSYMTQKHHY